MHEEPPAALKAHGFVRVIEDDEALSDGEIGKGRVAEANQARC